MERVQNPLPDETLLTLPPAWSAGVVKSQAGEPATGALERWSERLEQGREAIEAAFTLAGNEPYIDSVRSYLAGQPDPLGAATVSQLLRDHHLQESLLEETIDAWQLEHGLVFAAAAVVEDGGIGSEYTTVRTPGGSHWYVTTGKIRPSSGDTVADWEYKATARLRGTIVSAATETRLAARAAAAERCTGGGRTTRAALLFPSETEWVLDACSKYSSHANATDGGLWPLITAPEQLAAMHAPGLEADAITVSRLGALMAGIGTDSLEALVATLDLPWNRKPGDRKTVLAGIAMLPSDQAMRYLLERLGTPFVAEAASAAVDRFPVRALRIAAALSKGADERERLNLAAAIGEIRPELLAAALERLGDSEKDAVEALTERPGASPVATAEELPELLTTPPWTTVRSQPKSVVVKGLQPDGRTALVWQPGESERVAAEAEDQNRSRRYRWDLKAASLERRNDSQDLSEMLAYGPMEFAEAFFAGWDGRIEHYSSVRRRAFAQAILVRFGVEAADRIVGHLEGEPRDAALLAPILSTRAARLAAHWFVRVKAGKPAAAAWLDRHGPEAAGLLIPDALGTNRRIRAGAEAALLHIARNAGPQPVVDAAEPYGEAALEAIRSLLDRGPSEPKQVRVREPGGWFQPRRLPQVLLKEGSKALPDDAVRHLAVALATADGTGHDDWITGLGTALDIDSVRAFGWAAFESWIESGAPREDRWALNSLSHFGDDETVGRLAPMIREWPGQNQHHRAVAGLKVLGRIGSETALRTMQDISQRAKFKAIKAEAGQQMQVIAGSLGLTREQLADRLLPDFGLGEDSAMVLDYGPRTFRVALDEQLKPYVTDDSGKRRKALPKPGAKDDPELAGAAYKRFADLKKQLRTVATDQLRRLEAAMISARTWEREEFEQYLLRHPLMRHLTRRMIWLAETGGDRFGFRVAEDDTFSDAEDETVELPEGAVIRLAHPVHLRAEERDAWGRILADYEILQPFEQLSRPVMAFTQEELKTGRLARFEGATAAPGHILGLTGRGWVRGRPQDNGTEFGFHFPLPAGGVVAVELSPGLQIGMGVDVEDQELQTVFLADSVDGYYRNRGNGHPVDIDPAVASEVLAALDRITAKE